MSRAGCRDCGGDKLGVRGVRCALCFSAYAARNRAEREHLAGTAKVRASQALRETWQRRKGETPELFRSASQLRWRGIAHECVAKAIRLGLLPKLDGTLRCADCGSVATLYEHRDYSRVIDVEPACHACNMARGQGLMPEPRTFPHLTVSA